MTALLAPVLRPAVRAEAPVPYTGRRTSGSSLLGGGGSATAALNATRTSGTLFAIIDALSTAVASADWCLYRLPGDGQPTADEDRERVTNHAAWSVWNRPNPFFTTSLLVETVQQHFDLTGLGYMVMVKAAKIPIELWPVRPDRLSPVPHPTKFLKGYIYTSPDGDKIPLEVDEVIPLRKPDPADIYGGMGAVASIGIELQASKAAAQWNASFFENSAEPGGIIEVPQALSDTEFDELSTRWNEQHRGVSRAHRVAILEHGKWIDRKYTQRDMQFAELRNASRDVLMEAFRVSKTALGITDDVNRASALAAQYQFSRGLVVPRLDRWQQALNHHLLPAFGKTSTGVAFGYTSPVDEDEEAANAERISKAEASSIYIRDGWNPQSVKEKLGLPDMDWGNGEVIDPDRELLIELVKGAPSLAPIILPMLGFTLPAAEPASEPPVPNAPPPAGGPVEDSAALVVGDEPPPAPLLPPAQEAEPTVRHGHPHPARAADEGAPTVDLTPVQQAYERRLDQLLDQMATIRVAWRRSLRQQVQDAIDANDVTALTSMTLDSTDARDRIVEAMRLIATDAAAQVRREAAEQGVTLPANAARAGVQATTEPVPDEEMAATLALLMAAANALSAGTEAIRANTRGATGTEVAAEVDTFLTERSTAREDAQLGGLLTGSQNRARVDTMAAGPIGSLYADETLDSNTCPNCRSIDGRYICSTDDLGPYEALYTALGGYVDCDGRERCRGTVTGAWRPETTEDGS